MAAKVVIQRKKECLAEREPRLLCSGCTCWKMAAGNKKAEERMLSYEQCWCGVMCVGLLVEFVRLSSNPE